MAAQTRLAVTRSTDMSQTLSTTIKGVSLDERLLIAALENLPTLAFSKSDFGNALTDLGFGHASDVIWCAA